VRPRANGCGRRPTRRPSFRCNAPNSAFAMSRYAGRSSARTPRLSAHHLVRRTLHRPIRPTTATSFRSSTFL
jgi:hypothetical protein